MVTEQELAETEISASYEIYPVKNVVGDISGLLGDSCGELIGSFYPKNISKKSNIVITELVNNAVLNNTDDTSKIVLEIRVSKDFLRIRVKNAVDYQQFEKVRAHIHMINSAGDLKELLARTIRKKRKERQKGGLGLIRLAAENKFSLSVDYDNTYLTVGSEFAIGGS